MERKTSVRRFTYTFLLDVPSPQPAVRSPQALVSSPLELFETHLHRCVRVSNQHRKEQPLHFKAILLSLKSMLFFREIYTRSSLTILTGMIFLNTGFLIMEGNILELHKTRQLVENISKIIGNSPLEEKRDTTTSSFSSSGLGEEEYLAGHHRSSYPRCFFFIHHTSSLFHVGGLAKGYLKNFCPPPEV